MNNPYRNPYCGKTCFGENNGYCGNTKEPCTAPYDLTVDRGDCHLKLRTYMMNSREIQKVMKVIGKIS